MAGDRLKQYELATKAIEEILKGLAARDPLSALKVWLGFGVTMMEAMAQGPTSTIPRSIIKDALDAYTHIMRMAGAAVIRPPEGKQ